MVVYLQPEPEDEFNRITEAIVAAFPDYPPYGGAFDELIPHATIVETDPDTDLEAEIRGAIGPQLPIRETAAEVGIMANRDQRWEIEATVSLADSS